MLFEDSFRSVFTIYRLFGMASSSHFFNLIQNPTKFLAPNMLNSRTHLDNLYINIRILYFDALL